MPRGGRRAKTNPAAATLAGLVQGLRARAEAVLGRHRAFEEHSQLLGGGKELFCEECSDDFPFVPWPCDAVKLAQAVLEVGK